MVKKQIFILEQSNSKIHPDQLYVFWDAGGADGPFKTVSDLYDHLIRVHEMNPETDIAKDVKEFDHYGCVACMGIQFINHLRTLDEGIDFYGHWEEIDDVQQG